MALNCFSSSTSRETPEKAKAAPSCIDVALVLAVDSSASVSSEEFDLQQNGIAAAFRDPAVLDAVATAGRVAVSVVFWGSEGLPKPQSDWMLVEGEEGAENFARTVESMPRQVTGDTGLGAGLMTALERFNALDLCTIRKVVNVSGDGEETRVYRRQRRSPAPSQVRDMANSRNVEINALAIAMMKWISPFIMLNTSLRGQMPLSDDTLSSGGLSTIQV